MERRKRKRCELAVMSVGWELEFILSKAGTTTGEFLVRPKAFSTVGTKSVQEG